MENLLWAIALALAMEGIGFALFPKSMSRALAEMSRLPSESLRALGASALALSALAAFLSRAMR